MSNKKLFLICSVLVLYTTLSLACDPLAYRLIEVAGFTTTGAALLFAALYPLLDLLTRLTSRNFVIGMILILHLSDFIFTYSLNWINQLPYPAEFHHILAYTTVFSPMPRMFWGGIIGALIGSVVEVAIFAFLQKRVKSFYFASLFSTIIILLGHNVPTDIYAYSQMYKNYMSLVFTNFTVNVILLLGYTGITTLILRFLDKQDYKLKAAK